MSRDQEAEVHRMLLRCQCSMIPQPHTDGGVGYLLASRSGHNQHCAWRTKTAAGRQAQIKKWVRQMQVSARDPLFYLVAD